LSSSKRLRPPQPLILSALLLWACFGLAADLAAEALEAGIERADITPELSQASLVGYVNRWGQGPTGVRDPVSCTALYLAEAPSADLSEQGGVALVSCDLVGISPALYEAVSQKMNLPSVRLMLVASHTHSGPGGHFDFALVSSGLGAYAPLWTQDMAGRIALAIQAARQHKQEVRLRFTQSELPGIVANRRDPEAQYDHGTRRFQRLPIHPAFPSPARLTTLWFDDLQGQPVAVLFHFAMHNTVLGADNPLISADWAGRARQQIEARFPTVLSLYVNGAEADQAPLMLPDQLTPDDYLEWLGQTLGEAVIQQRDRAEPMADSPLRVNWSILPLPPARPLGIPLLGPFVPRDFLFLPLQVIRIGEFVLMGLPLEATARLGQKLEQQAHQAGFRHALVAGLANSYLFYSTLPDEYQASSYESQMNFWGTELSEQLIDEMQVLLEGF
jgi:hypothetical protein